MSLIADGVLIATCLTTAIYCLVLSRRLKRLTSTDDGIGQQILRLNKVLEETKAAVADIQGTTRSASEDLSREIEEAKRLGGQLQRQIARAMKSGARRPDPADEGGSGKPSAFVPVTTAPPEPETEEDAGKDAPAAVVDFEAAAAVDDLEADLEVTPGEAPVDDVPQEDVAEAVEHWPFQPDDGGEDGDPEDDEAAAEPARLADGGAGLLRVERMAV